MDPTPNPTNPNFNTNTVQNIGVPYNNTPLGVAHLFAGLSLSITEGQKILIYCKDGRIFLSSPVDLPFVTQEPSPSFVGAIYSNTRFNHLSRVFFLHVPIWEFDDQQNMIRVDSVFSDLLFTRYRKFVNSSLITTEEAIAVIADWFMRWPYMKNIINTIFSQMDPNKPSNMLK